MKQAGNGISPAFQPAKEFHVAQWAELTATLSNGQNCPVILLWKRKPQVPEFIDWTLTACTTENNNSNN